MSYSKDELVPPAWIDADYVKRILEHDGNESVEIKSYTISPAATVSDHFTSLIFRVKISYSSKTQQSASVSLIVKTPPTEDGLKKDFADAFDMFTVEGAVFSKILPICHDMLSTIGCYDPIGARMLFNSSEQNTTIVLEDLKELGYIMPTSNYPSPDFYRAMFCKLALFHATTFKMHADGNVDVSDFKGFFLNMPNNAEVFLFTDGKDLLVDVIKNISGLEIYSRKLKSISNKTLLDKCAQVINEPGHYNVLNHGDLYVKNMMMKNKLGEKDVIFVDFQSCHWGSPAVDITCIASFIPIENRDEVIQTYFEIFIDTLKKLGYEQSLPTFMQLKNDMRRCRCIELYLLIVSAPFLYVDESYTDTENMDINTFMSDREFIIQSFSDEKYVSLLRMVMPMFLEEGYFDDFA